MDLSQVVDGLLKVFEEKRTPPGDGREFHVSRTVSILAVLYEKARNAVEFRADHLVRRAAIERILKRRIMINGGSQSIAENLAVELLWARYIDSSILSEAKVQEIQKIIDRYLEIKHTVFGSGHHASGITWDIVLGIASSEIDETIVSPLKREALINFFYQAIRAKIPSTNQNDQRMNMLSYIAVERAYAESDDALIRYHLLKIILPSWHSMSSQDVSKEITTFTQTIAMIQSSLIDPLSDRLSHFVRKQTPAYLLLRDFFLETDSNARHIIEDPAQFDQKLSEIAGRRYKETGAKVRRAVGRSIIYIFLTKMIFALALEAPYDFYIAHKITYLPLIVNTLFPPILLFLIAGLFSIPGADNTSRLINRIQKIIYHFNELQKESDLFSVLVHERRPILMGVFSIFYLGMFVVTFGLINMGLNLMHFSIASKIIFVFFIALVSFFAYRIRQSAKEYEMVERQGILEPIFDLFLLPVVRAGHLLSKQIARLNIFIFFFDFILEAPLKVIFDVVEEWIRFLRSKKDEII